MTDIKSLTRKALDALKSEWGLNRTLDRNLASRATSKGHIHRIGPSARPSKGVSSHQRKRTEAWTGLKKLLEGRKP